MAASSATRPAAAESLRPPTPAVRASSPQIQRAFAARPRATEAGPPASPPANCFVDFLAEQLADMSRSFHGDLQVVVLLATVGQVSLSAAIAAEAGGRSPAELAPERRGITTNRLADCTGIPRETARRKLIAMEKMGWLTREDNFWYLTTSGEDTVARQALAALDDRALSRTARLYSSLSRLIDPAT